MRKKEDIPLFQTPIIETHCHLDYLHRPVEEILSQCKKVGVQNLITISVSPENLNNVLEIAKNHKNIFCTQGIHPHEAKLFNDSIYEKIKKNSLDKNVKAIGEIGLDYHYNHSPKTKQIETFKKQLELAIELDLSVVIHSRDADEDTIQILNEYAPQMKRKGVIHSFTSGEKLAKKALEHDFYLGFNGIITFKNAENVRNIVSITPLDKILLETDSPYLTPVPYRGEENAPFYIPFIAKKVSEIKGIPVEELLEVCLKNSHKMFQL